MLPGRTDTYQLSHPRASTMHHQPIPHQLPTPCSYHCALSWVEVLEERHIPVVEVIHRILVVVDHHIVLVLHTVAGLRIAVVLRTVTAVRTRQPAETHEFAVQSPDSRRPIAGLPIPRAMDGEVEEVLVAVGRRRTAVVRIAEVVGRHSLAADHTVGHLRSLVVDRRTAIVDRRILVAVVVDPVPGLGG